MRKKIIQNHAYYRTFGDVKKKITYLFIKSSENLLDYCFTKRKDTVLEGLFESFALEHENELRHINGAYTVYEFSF